MPNDNWTVHLLVSIYSLLLISSFAFSIGWTGVGLDDPPDVARHEWMQKSNHPIRRVTLILACIAELISVIFLVNILAQKAYPQLCIPIICMIAAGLGIANAVVDRPKRGDALGITTMTVNGLALVGVLYYLMFHIAKNKRLITPYGTLTLKYHS